MGDAYGNFLGGLIRLFLGVGSLVGGASGDVAFIYVHGHSQGGGKGLRKNCLFLKTELVILNKVNIFKLLIKLALQNEIIFMR